MPYVFDLKDRVKDYCYVSGLDDAVMLGEPPLGFQSFEALPDGASTYYTITDKTTGQWEVGVGAYEYSTGKLYRNEIYSSSDGGAKVDFPAVPVDYTQEAFITYPSRAALAADNPLRLVAFFITYSPSADETVALYTCAEDFIFPADFTGSVGKVEVAPSTAVTILIKNNGTGIGEVEIDTLGGVTISSYSVDDIPCVAGDQLSFVASSSASTADGMQNFSLTLKGSKY